MVAIISCCFMSQPLITFLLCPQKEIKGTDERCEENDTFGALTLVEVGVFRGKAERGSPSPYVVFQSELISTMKSMS